MLLSDRGRRAAIEILNHLQRHPDAKDALAGIHQWWLRDPEWVMRDELTEAVKYLLAENLLCSFESSPGLELFGATARFLDSPQSAVEELRRGYRSAN